MKQAIQQLIEQHKLFKQECEIELAAEELKEMYSQLWTKCKMKKEIEMRTLFIS